MAVLAMLAVSVLRRGWALQSLGKVLISRHAVGPAETLPQGCLIPENTVTLGWLSPRCTPEPH